LKVIERGRNYTKYRLDDGRIQQVITPHPQNYEYAAGDWRPIDCTPAPDNSVPGFDHSVTKAPYRFRFPKVSPQPYRVETRRGQYIQYRAQGVNAVRGTIERNKVTYAGTWTDADLVLVAVPEGVKEQIVLHSLSAPTTYSFEVKLKGLTLQEEPDGSITLLDELGDVALRIPAPYAVDAEGNIRPVTITHRVAGNKDYLDLAVDEAWLASAIYPVTIDPTTTIQPDPTAGKDARIDPGAADTNYGTDTELWVGGADGDDERSLIEFSMTSVPSDTDTIISAELQLYCSSVSNDTARDITVHQITSSWDEGTVTWNTKPSHEVAAEDTVSVTSAGSWYSWDITQLVKDWKNGIKANYGVMLINADAGTLNIAKIFYSSDYTTDTSLRPKLVVTYSEKPTATLTTPTGTENSPTQYNDEITPLIEWTYSDPESDPQAKYQVQVYDTSNNLVYDSGEVASSSTSHEIPSSVELTYGTTYKVRVRVHDGTSWSAWSSDGYLQCILTAPTGLTVTPDSNNAQIQLQWTDAGKENSAGFNIYRKKSSDTSYSKLNTSLVVNSTYNDQAVATGVSYDYKITEVATDGYESAYSTEVTNNSVTFTEWYLGSTQIEVISLDGEEVWKRSVQEQFGKRYPVVQAVGPSGGRGGHRLTLGVRVYNQTELDNILSELESTEVALRDPLGRVWRVAVVGPVRYQQILGTGGVDLRLLIPLREVT